MAKATHIEPSPRPALMAWPEHVVDAERHRGIGDELPNLSAADAIDDDENVTALAAPTAIPRLVPRGPRARVPRCGRCRSVSGRRSRARDAEIATPHQPSWGGFVRSRLSTSG
jgi:hypothetical protein